VLAIFRLIDQYSHGKVVLDNLRIFMSKFECAQDLDEVDLGNWIKRYDSDADGGLKFVDLINALQTQTNY
jgi:Ca2+-binding EF-hand superfamily protein